MRLAKHLVRSRCGGSLAVVVLAVLALVASEARAQDNRALIDTLIKKGILTADEAAQIQAEANQAAAAPVAPAVSATSAMKTIVGARMYLDISRIDASTADGTKVTPGGIGLDVKRMYFGVTHVFDGVWSANITTDAAYSASTGATSLFLKTAYVQAKLSAWLVIQAGSAGMPWIPFVEDLYGFRYVENTLIDRMRVGNSADWGLHVSGSAGIFSYNVAVVNGGGFKNPTRSRTMDFAGRVSAEPIRGLVLALGGYRGDLGRNAYGSPATRTADRFDALVSYAHAGFKVAGEYFWEQNWGLTASPRGDEGEGYAVWGNAPLRGPFSVFARFDDTKMSRKQHPGMDERYFNGGFQFHVMTGIDLALVYKHDHVANPASVVQTVNSDEFGAFSQVEF